MSRNSTITVECEVELEDYEEEIIEYLEDHGYVVIDSASNSSEAAGALDEHESTDVYRNSQAALRNIVQVCSKYGDFCNTFYRELVASIVGMPSYTDRETLLEKLKEKM